MGNSMSACRGTLLSDPEIRYTREGMATTTFALAIESSIQVVNAARTDVTVTGEMAENAALSLTAGMEVVVMGEVTAEMRNLPGGGTRMKVGLVAEDIGTSVRHATVDVNRLVRKDYIEDDDDSEDEDDDDEDDDE